MSKKLIAEFIGTYFLVFAGTGAVVIDTMTHSLTHVGVAATFGLVVMALIYTFGHVSGAHFNPAVTLAFFFLKRMKGKETVYFIVTQFCGACTSSLTLYMMFGNVGNLGATLPYGTWQQSAVLEFILTFVLMMVILASAVHEKALKSFAGIAIGATVGLEAMFGGPISGASMNPARSFSPALVSGHLEYIGIYLLSIFLGALTAAAVYRLLHE
ncbi:MIP family channel protein [Paenibacillus beijingensis]|uniref:MIP family channel protein n=1 Tax=Paenibacillus beijingensis TaxID=1126833 RepID=A0A0D5NRR4_9BACL|nr:MIP family channel protein [Paenibacillus beijingensis]